MTDVQQPQQAQAPAQEQQAQAPSQEQQAPDNVNPIDLAVAKKMGLYKDGETPPPFSSERGLVNDMVAFAREHKIPLPKFTADPYKIANAIATYEEEE